MRPPVPQRVVEYLGDTTRHLLADLQAETGIYYKTRSSAQQHTANVVTKSIPPSDSAIEAEYDTHMANEITHSVTGETLNLQKYCKILTHSPLGKTEVIMNTDDFSNGTKEESKALAHVFSFPTVLSLRDEF
jgi:hypothetical protein